MDKPFAYYIESNATPGECWELIEGREPVEYVGDDDFTIRPLYITRPLALGGQQGEASVRDMRLSHWAEVEPFPARAEAQDEGAAGEPNALPIDLAPRDGTILRLRVRYEAGVKGVWTPLEDAEESWTIGFNSLDNTGEDRWQFVGWDWSQDYLLEAPGGEVIGWLPFHGEQAHPSPTPAADAIQKIEADRDAWKLRGDNHWETLRSIREFAREGDCERIIQWVNDAGSGYTQSAEQTLGQMTDRALKAEESLKTTQSADEVIKCPDCGQGCKPGSTHNCPYRGRVSVPLKSEGK